METRKGGPHHGIKSKIKVQHMKKKRVGHGALSPTSTTSSAFYLPPHTNTTCGAGVPTSLCCSFPCPHPRTHKQMDEKGASVSNLLGKQVVWAAAVRLRGAWHAAAGVWTHAGVMGEHESGCCVRSVCGGGVAGGASCSLTAARASVSQVTAGRMASAGTEGALAAADACCIMGEDGCGCC